MPDIVQIKLTEKLRGDNMNIYFDCKSGISGDMSVAALLDAGADKAKLEKTLNSLKLDEFSYNISTVLINSVKAVDFDVKLPHHEHTGIHHHEHRNLNDIYKIIDKTEMTQNAQELAKKIFRIVAEAEAEVHNKNIEEIHFHEVGAIDSIVDIISFSVLLDDLNPENIYFSTLTEGRGTVECTHGTLNVPVPAVCEILAKYQIPITISDNEGEMITPTGAAIAAALYENKKLPKNIILEKTGYGAGKRKYKNPVLRAMIFHIKED